MPKATYKPRLVESTKSRNVEINEPSKVDVDVAPPLDIVGEIIHNRAQYNLGEKPANLSITGFPNYMVTACKRLARQVYKAIGTDPGEPIVHHVCVVNGFDIISRDVDVLNLIETRGAIYEIENVPAMLVDEAAALSSKWRVSIPNPMMSGTTRKNFRISQTFATDYYTLLGRLDVNVGVFGLLCIIFALDEHGKRHKGAILNDHAKVFHDIVEMFKVKCRMSVAMGELLVDFINKGKRSGLARLPTLRGKMKYRYVKDGRRRR